MGPLTSILGAITNIFTQSLTRVTGMFNKVWTLLKKPLTKITSFLRNVIGKLLKKPSERDDYFSIGEKLVSKRLIFFLIVGLVVGLYFFLKSGLPWLEGRLWTVDLNIGSEKYKTFNGKARVYSFGTLVFEGNMEAGKMQGYGVQYDNAGVLMYKGNFEKNKYSGAGESYQGDIKIYEGNFANGLYEGEGTLFYLDGNPSYSGNFDKGEKNGAGIEYDDETGLALYNGNFESGKRSGTGVEYFKEKDANSILRTKYEGAFKEGAYDGDGKLYYDSTGIRYIGQFKNGLFSGTGTEYADGTGNYIYSGEFKENIYEGKGTLYSTTHKNIKEYYGDFQNGKKNGTGTSYDLLGSVSFEGKFTNGEIGYVSYLGKTTDEIMTDFKKPSNDETDSLEEYRYLTYANLDVCMIFVKGEPDKDGNVAFTLERVVIGFNHAPYQLTQESTEAEIEQKLGMKLYASSTITINDMYKMAFSKIASTLAGDSSANALKYMSDDKKYFIRIYKSKDGKRLEAVEVATATAS